MWLWALFANIVYARHNWDTATALWRQQHRRSLNSRASSIQYTCMVHKYVKHLSHIKAWTEILILDTLELSWYNSWLFWIMASGYLCNFATIIKCNKKITDTSNSQLFMDDANDSPVRDSNPLYFGEAVVVMQPL